MIPSRHPSADSKRIGRIQQLAANPKALSLKDLKAALDEAQTLNGILASYEALDAEYQSRLTTFFPLLLEAANDVLNKDGHREAQYRLERLIAQIGAPTQPAAPVFKMGDYVVPTDDAHSWMKGVYQVKGLGQLCDYMHLEDMANPELSHRMSLFRAATNDEVRQHLIDSASKLGYVVGARVQRPGMFPQLIKRIHVWMPGDTIDIDVVSNEVMAAMKKKPFVWIESSGFAFLLNDLTLAPEPTHYLYRVSMEGLTVRRDLVGQGRLDDMTGWCRRLTSPHGAYAYQVYPIEMPTRQTV